MILGVPKEIKTHEYRVAMVPGSVRALVAQGHTVYVQKGAGIGASFKDEDYINNGAQMLESLEDIYARAHMIVKVKEPQKKEYSLIRKGQILFTYLHLAPAPELTQALLKAQCWGIAYETITDAQGVLPLLIPMSEVAGRLSLQAAFYGLQTFQGGSGVLLSGLSGVGPGTVLIVGGGVVGTNAALMAMGIGARVTIMDNALHRLRTLDTLFGRRLETVYATEENLESYAAKADVIIGAVLIPGAAAPKILKRQDLARLKPGSVLVDVAIDQGGCFETSRPTTYKAPTYVLDGIIHYCVANMPSAVAHSASVALSNATLKHTMTLAQKGVKKALREDPHLLQGLNVCEGHVTHPQIAEALKKSYTSPETFLL